MRVLLDILFAFAFLYPLLMAWTWMVGGLWFFFKREYHEQQLPEPSNEGVQHYYSLF